jgi:hypothetical protein
MGSGCYRNREGLTTVAKAFPQKQEFTEASNKGLFGSSLCDLCGLCDAVVRNASQDSITDQEYKGQTENDRVIGLSWLRALQILLTGGPIHGARIA